MKGSFKLVINFEKDAKLALQRIVDRPLYFGIPGTPFSVVFVHGVEDAFFIIISKRS